MRPRMTSGESRCDSQTFFVGLNSSSSRSAVLGSRWQAFWGMRKPSRARFGLKRPRGQDAGAEKRCQEGLFDHRGSLAPCIFT